MPFWRRKRDEERSEEPDLSVLRPVEPPTPPEVEPDEAVRTPAEAEAADATPIETTPDTMPPAEAHDAMPPAEAPAAWAAVPAALSDPASAAPADVPASEPPVAAVPEPAPAGPAPFDPTAFLAVAPAEKMDQGLERTRSGFMTQLRGFLGGDDPQWDDVEETLITGDVGAALAIDLVERARRRRDPEGAEASIRAELAALLLPRDLDWSPRPAAAGGPAILLIVGVNGTGKTTTIGKLAARYAAEGRTIILAAADTFRAAAIDQLRIWAERAAVPVVAHAPGADPGAVVYDALDAAVARGADLVIADTAGRLHTKSNLMDELTKVRRIIDKRLPGSHPETLFVLDATTGQNGLAQARAFHDAVGLTGIVLTKLDSTSKGGIVFAIEDALKVPVRFVGVGEGIDDLLVFDPEAFVAALFA